MSPITRKVGNVMAVDPRFKRSASAGLLLSFFLFSFVFRSEGKVVRDFRVRIYFSAFFGIFCDVENLARCWKRRGEHDISTTFPFTFFFCLKCEGGRTQGV